MLLCPDHHVSLETHPPLRYVGILHEINSSDSTVSLENVRSFGTEGRKGDVSEEVAPSDQVYEYIVFRGSDVKDLRIEEGPGSVKENKPPAVPNDPAILGVSDTSSFRALPYAMVWHNFDDEIFSDVKHTFV